VEKKRRSRTRRDQPQANKPGQSHQKSSPHPRARISTAQPTSPGPCHSPPRHKADLRVSGVEASSSYFSPLPPRALSHTYGAEYPSTTSPSQKSSPSSYYPSTGAFDHFQHVPPTMRPTPDSLSPSSPGYISRHLVAQTITVSGFHPATAQFNDVYGPNCSHSNECDGEQGRTEPVYLHPTVSRPPAHNGLAPGSAHWPEQTTATFPSESYGLVTPTIENLKDSYFYPGYEDRTAGRSSQNACLITDRSSQSDRPTAFTVIHT
jgi:hypothetical protein